MGLLTHWLSVVRPVRGTRVNTNKMQWTQPLLLPPRGTHPPQGREPGSEALLTKNSTVPPLGFSKTLP